MRAGKDDGESVVPAARCFDTAPRRSSSCAQWQILMTRPAVTARVDESLAEAAGRMHDVAVGSVVVVDGGSPVGILTERDLIRSTAAGADPDGDRVSTWMTPDPDCVALDTQAEEAWESLAAHGYRHIPVMSSDELAGIVSMRDLMGVAELRPLEGTPIDVPRGLKGVVVADTGLGDVRGLEGLYHYRQYSAVEIAEQLSFEDAWFLLTEGWLPSARERRDFMADVAPLRTLSEPVLAILPAISRAASAASVGPLDALRTALSLLATAEGFRPSLDATHAELRANALRVCAAVPTLVAALHRLTRGDDPIAPRPDLGHAANYLVHGERAGAR